MPPAASLPLDVEGTSFFFWKKKGERIPVVPFSLRHPMFRCSEWNSGQKRKRNPRNMWVPCLSAHPLSTGVQSGYSGRGWKKKCEKKKYKEKKIFFLTHDGRSSLFEFDEFVSNSRLPNQNTFEISPFSGLEMEGWNLKKKNFFRGDFYKLDEFFSNSWWSDTGIFFWTLEEWLNIKIILLRKWVQGSIHLRGSLDWVELHRGLNEKEEIVLWLWKIESANKNYVFRGHSGVRTPSVFSLICRAFWGPSACREPDVSKKFLEAGCVWKSVRVFLFKKKNNKIQN